MAEIDSQWFAIINPVAGRGKGLQDWPLISRLLREKGIIPAYSFTEHKYHAIELAVEAVNAGYRKFIVVGGDGTLHEVVNGLFIQEKISPRDILLAIIGVGAGNGWLRMEGVPSRYPDAVRAITEGVSVLQNVGKISYHKSHYRQTRYMANVAGIGFDAFMNYRSHHLKEEGHRSKWMRFWSPLATVLAYSSTSVRIWIDDRLSVSDRIYSASIDIENYEDCLSEKLHAKGAFDIAVIRRIGKFGVLRRFWALYRGNMGKLEKIALDKGRKIRIDSLPEVRIEVDGEVLGFSPFEFEIVDNAINVVVSSKLLDTKAPKVDYLRV